MSEVSGQNGEGNITGQATQAENTPQMPDGLPESFWDAEAGQVKVNDLIGSYSELSKFKTETESKFAARPESADKYEVKLPEGFQMPEGVEFKVDADNPLVKAVQETVFNAGGSQADFEKLVGAFVQDTLMETQRAQETAQKEMEALGQNAKVRIEAIETFAKANLSEAEAGALLDSLTTKSAVEAVEKLISKAQGPQMNGAGAASSPQTVSEAELSSKMRDPRYWRDRDPAFVREVTEGFQKLYRSKSS